MWLLSFLSEDSVVAGSVFAVVWEYTCSVHCIFTVEIRTFCGEGRGNK